MKCFIDGEEWIGSSLSQLYMEDRRKYFIILDFDEIPELDYILNISDRIILDCLTVKVSKFESHEVFDYFIINVPNREDIEAAPDLYCVFFSQSLLVLITGSEILQRDLVEYVEREQNGYENQKTLLYFLEQLTANDTEFLQRLEEEIEDLEDDEIMGSNADNVMQISRLRKRLMRCKNYYEQMFEVLSQLCENTNDLLDSKQLRFYRNVLNKVDRLYHNVLNLRDYVTHVRESYQAQLDIQTNRTMKLFTTLTAVFAPLTLLVGWYGMNFNMPEFDWTFGYPFLMGIASMMLIASILLCKIKRWF